MAKGEKIRSTKKRIKKQLLDQMLYQDELEQEENIMDEVKKIEHCKILNTDTPDNSASDLDSFLKKNKKIKK